MRSEEGDDPMTVEEMKKKKTELGFSCEQISDRSGVPLGTVQKIFSGITKRPRYDTICQLEKAFPMEHNELPVIYGFEDQVPVNIFAGKCQIDFSEIYSYIEFLEEKE